MIIEKIKKFMADQRNIYQAKSNRASELGHSCLRYLVFSRTRAKDRPLHTTELEFIFSEGRLHEKSVLRLLEDAGFEVFAQQREFTIDEYNISGHIDAKILIDGIIYPLEIKSASPYMFESFNSVEDLRCCKYEYARKYVAQMQLYLYMCHAMQGYFIFKNKVNGQLKEIKIIRDNEFIEELFKKAQEINIHVANKTLPPITVTYDLCENCGFKHLCGSRPATEEDAIEIMNIPEVENNIKRMLELKSAAAEYKRLNDSFKTQFKGIKCKIIGNYMLTSKKTLRKGYFVEESESWRTEIKILDETKIEEINNNESKN